MDRALVVRASALYVPICLAAIAWLVRPPGPRDRAAALLATAWNIASLFALHLAALRFGWWSYSADGATLAGFPVDLYLGWALLWGALPSLIARNAWHSAGAVVVAVALDLAAMPRMEPVVHLGDAWLVGEVFAVLVCLVPSQLLAHWTRRGERAPYRAVLQVGAFIGIVFGVLTQIILEQSGGSWAGLWSRPRWVTSLLLQCVAAAGLLGVSAVQEFATRGRGTPVPLDPPLRFVTTGPYAYVRNPMQLSAALSLAVWAAALGSWWLAAASAMAVVYGAGFASGDEEGDLEQRFGVRWRAYRSLVRSWIPRWRPVSRSAVNERANGLDPAFDTGIGPSPQATLYVAEECGPCSEVRAWFEQRGPVGLEIVAAERHPSRSLQRITYDPGDGTGDSDGVAAIARALEHVHLGWALLAMFVRLPGVVQFLQLVTDASGGSPRSVVRYCDRELSFRAEARSAGVDESPSSR